MFSFMFCPSLQYSIRRNFKFHIYLKTGKDGGFNNVASFGKADNLFTEFMISKFSFILFVKFKWK